MTLAKVKEQDWMTAFKSKGTRWDDACKSKGTRWNSACKSKSPKYPYTQRINCCHDLQQMRNPLPTPFTTVNIASSDSVLLFDSSR